MQSAVLQRIKQTLLRVNASVYVWLFNLRTGAQKVF